MPKPWEINWLEKEISEYEKENNTQKFVKDIPKGKKPWEINWLDVELKASMGSRVVSTSDSKNLGDGLTLDTVFEGLKRAESGGAHIDAKTGKLVTSPAGAEGITQLMPKTAERPGYGIKPVQDKSEGEYLRVGKEYLAAMYKKYGDWEMSLAAYNAGSGSVDAAKGKAERFGGSWKDYLPKPKETLPYIDKILGRNPKGIVNATPDKMSEGLTGKQALENVKGVAYDVASMLPVSGEAISAKEAYDKLKQGDLSGSALAAVGAIPLVGSVGRVRNRLTTNFLRDISDEAPVLYREVSGDRFLNYLQGDSHFGPEMGYYAELPEMALGQGSNKGIRFQISTKGLDGKVNLDKPALEESYLKNAGEFIIKSPISDIVKNITSIEINSEAFKGLSKGEKMRLENELKSLEKTGVTIIRKY